MFSSHAQVNTLSFMVAQQVSSGNQAFVPVNANQYIYAHFQHVSGVPTSEGGVSISTLQILNSLIDSMMKKNAETIHLTTETEATTLIPELQKKAIEQHALSLEIPYIPAAPVAGSLFSLQA